MHPVVSYISSKCRLHYFFLVALYLIFNRLSFFIKNSKSLKATVTAHHIHLLSNNTYI